MLYSAARIISLSSPLFVIIIVKIQIVVAGSRRCHVPPVGVWYAQTITALDIMAS